MRFLRLKLQMSPSGRRRDDSGVSLTELAVTTSILAVILATIGVAFDGWIQIAKISQDRTISLEEGRLINERMSKELRMATGIPESPTEAPTFMASTPVGCSSTPVTTYGEPYALTEAGENSVAFWKVAQNGSRTRVRFKRATTNRMTYATRSYNVTNRTGLYLATNESTATVGVEGGPVVVNGAAGTSPRIFAYMTDSVSPMTPGVTGYMSCAQLTQVSVVNILLYLDKDPAVAIGSSTIDTSIFIRSTGYWK